MDMISTLRDWVNIFFFVDFLAQCAEVYKILLHSPLPSSHETVVVPTSEVPHTVHQNNSEPRGGGQGVDAMQFFRSLLPTCERHSIQYVMTIYIFNC